ncbi:thioredoxin domain-containing protein [Marilutibacter alkalisoli]|uniref:Thiol:disulfide interchange protein DsbA/DsbL n=1 Tax=Marilutibacter alkalisoli TaxID=2591633 RepID=A0A514BNK1_9GAMM|nr:thioredoxin domain-containing protein [Lysobacter alkalisoli]QDH68905.1 thiol:disulfide interchange protein DsbA/DsbL [Lysobacter alkalisoli]
MTACQTAARLLPMLLLVSMLGACSSETPTPPAAQPEPTAMPAEEATPGEATESDAPAATGEATDGEAANDEAAAPAEPAEAATANTNPVLPPQGPAPVRGTDYVEIANGQPFAPVMGKIEVVEVFGYTCPACAQFEPSFKAWKARQPADVNVLPLAAPFGGYWEPYARAFYSAETLGVLEQSHDAVFRAIHVERKLPPPPTVAKPEQLGAFYAAYGVDAKKFASTMNSFAVDARIKRAGQFLARSGVDSTPSLVVNGKYRITGGRTHDDQLRIADHLVAMERTATRSPAE